MVRDGHDRTDRIGPGTFSIAARDPDEGALGVAVSTALVGVGALCPFVSENAAVATQSFVKVAHGRRAVELADRGVSVPTACDALLADDDQASYRQLHGVGADGRQFAHTGEDCVDWAGDRTGEHHTVAGNMLSGSEVIETMDEAFVQAEGGLAERLVATLEAGEEAGGDKRGKISAALLVWAPEPRLSHNLRVDDADDPVGDLRDAFELARETEAALPEQADEMLGEYPEEILDFGLKY